MKKITVETIEVMSKDELRRACKDRGISYSKLSNFQMREALVAALQATPAEATPPAAAVPAAADQGAVVTTASKPAKATAPKGEERNGVVRPRPGKCLTCWEALEELHQQTGRIPTNKDATEWATRTGANVSNAQQEVARLRKWHGWARPKAS